jgi:hypothetical protein
MFYTIQKQNEIDKKHVDYKVRCFHDYETFPQKEYDLKLRGRTLHCNCPAGKGACRHVQMFFGTKGKGLLDTPHLIDYTDASHMDIRPMKLFIVEETTQIKK